MLFIKMSQLLRIFCILKLYYPPFLIFEKCHIFGQWSDLEPGKIANISECQTLSQAQIFPYNFYWISLSHKIPFCRLLPSVPVEYIVCQKLYISPKKFKTPFPHFRPSGNQHWKCTYSKLPPVPSILLQYNVRCKDLNTPYLQNQKKIGLIREGVKNGKYSVRLTNICEKFYPFFPL